MTLREDDKLPWHRPVVVEEMAVTNDPLAGLTHRQLFFQAVFRSEESADMRMLLIAIWRFMGDEGGGVSMSYTQIARDCGFSEETAKRLVKAARDNSDSTDIGQRKGRRRAAHGPWLRVEVGGGWKRPGGGENLYRGLVPPDIAERVRQAALKASQGVSRRHPRCENSSGSQACPSDTPCSRGGVRETPRGVSRRHTDSGSTQDSDSTPNPRKRGREGSLELLIEGIRSASGRERVVDQFIAPLIRQRSYNAPNREFSLGIIADWAKEFSDEVFERALAELLKGRNTKVFQKNLEDALNEARAAEKREADHRKALNDLREREINDPDGAVRAQLADRLIDGDLGRRAADEDWLVELWHWVRERGLLPANEDQVRLVIKKRDEFAQQRAEWDKSLLHQRYAETGRIVRWRERRRFRELLGLPPDASAEDDDVVSIEERGAA